MLVLGLKNVQLSIFDVLILHKFLYANTIKELKSKENLGNSYKT